MVGKDGVCFRLVPPPNLPCLLRILNVVFPGGLQSSRRKQPPESHRREPREGSSWGPRGHSLPLLGGSPHFWRDRVEEVTQPPAGGEEDLRRGETEGAPAPPLSLPARGRPSQRPDTAASTPEPRPGPRTVTATPPGLAAPPQGRQPAGSRPTAPSPARPPGPTVPGWQRLRQ